MLMAEYDLIVVGAGHAGCEAACAAANMKASTLLITIDMEKIAQMSCNPAMGGIAKGQIVREIDALGGQSGIITDRTSIQFRMLNRSKGPAMWSPRAQCDRAKFSGEWRKTLENTDSLDIWQDSVVSLIVEDKKIKGVVTRLGVKFYSKAVILTNGTFLNGLMHIGRVRIEGGRIAEPASYGLTEQLKEYGFEAGRMKTGTPARVDGKTINFEKLSRQEGDDAVQRFSYLSGTTGNLEQLPCYIAYTNEKVHRILEKGFVDSPLYNGTIQSIGPRYCPSIEDKIVTFASRDSHHLFLEPEGVDTNEYYINGFSSSLPWNIQLDALRQVEGLENVKIFRPGYAIEYDYFPPTQLVKTLETKLIENLYFAGQINGTTGYEEAAAQGLMAGINAVLKMRKMQPFILRRDQAYIGVLIDDLVTKGVDEPYRMFTSRAEYRMLLRQDDADERLTPLACDFQLASQERIDGLQAKLFMRDKLLDFVDRLKVTQEMVNEYLMEKGTSPVKQSCKLRELVMRPQLALKELLQLIPDSGRYMESISERKDEIIEAAEISIKYSGYIERERINAGKLEKLEHIMIPDNFDFRKIHSLSMEARLKLHKIQPSTIGQASRIPGVSPADINVLLVRFGR
jgi:tRNA uridine 5-carboxymethylaminomethyl modification enzyme